MDNMEITSFEGKVNASDTYDTRGLDTHPGGYQTGSLAPGSYASGTIHTGQQVEIMDERVMHLA